MEISIIAAVAENNTIGNNNALIWHLKEDMKYFKEKTSGHHIIMGRKTFESISGGKPLPNRTSIIITHDKNYASDGIIVCHSLKEAIDKCVNEKEVFIIGGGQIYKEAINICDKLYITKIHKDFEGDVKFPEIDKNKWEISICDNHYSEKNHFNYTFLTYNKKNS